MKRKKITARSGEDILGGEIALANGFWSRLKGLMFRQELNRGEGLLLSPCHQIHTYMMRITIDAVFLNSQGEIVFLAPGMSPGRISPYVREARHVLELPAGTIERFSLQKKMLIHFSCTNTNRHILPERKDIIFRYKT